MSRDIARGVAKNTTIMFVQHVLTMGSSFLLMLFLPRFLGPVEYGKLFLAMSVVAILEIAVNYGGNFLIAKQVSRSPDTTGQTFIDSVSLRLMIGTVAYLSLLPFSYALSYPEDIRNIFLVYGLVLLFTAGSGTLYACFQGREMMQYTSLANLVDRVSLSVLGVTALMLGARTLHIAMLMVLTSFLNFAVLAVFARRVVPSIPRVNWGNVRAQLRQGLPYFLFAALGNVYHRIDSMMLSKMTPEAIVGYYGGAFRLFESLNFPYILSVALYPVLSRLWGQQTDAHRRTTAKSLEYVLLLGIPMAIGGIAFAREIIDLFYSLERYGPSVLVLQVLMAGLPFLFVDMILWTYLIASDRQRKLVGVSLVTIPITFFLNYLLIPYFQEQYGNGAIGSAVATGLTEVFVLLVSIRYTPREVLMTVRGSVIWKSVLAGLVMLAGIGAMTAIGVPWGLQIFVCLPVYFAAVMALRTFEPREVAFFREELEKRLGRVFGFLRRKQGGGE